MRTHTGLGLLVLGSLVACGESASGTPVAPASDSDTDDATVAEQPAGQRLAVLAERCRGCGKCARIDPEHFAMDRTSRTSIVLSNGNLGSPSLSRAMGACHDGAIVLR